MKVKPIKRTIKATALCNPNPSFVSQVKAGANQRPYRAIKMDAAVPVSETTTEERTMKIKQKGHATVSAIAPKGYGVMQFEFAKSAFPTSDKVKDWMDAGGYADYEIVETAKAFEVSDDASRFETASVRKIGDVAEGVVAFVGKLTAEAAADSDPADPADPAADTSTAKGDDQGAGDPPADPTDTAERGAFKACKDCTDAMKGSCEKAGACAKSAKKEGQVIDPPARQRSTPPAPVEGEGEPAPAPEVIERADDPAPADEPVEDVVRTDDPAPAAEGEGVQPGAQPTDAERARSMIEGIEANRTKGVYEAGDLGRIVNQLGWIVYDADYAGLSETVVSQIKSAALQLLEAFLTASSDAAEELAQVFRTAEEIEAVTAARSAEPVQPAPALDIAEIVRSAVSEAVAPLNDRIAAAESRAEEAVARADKAERELQERVETDASRGQTRKGAADPEPAPSTEKKQEVRSRASTNILSAFGSRHATR